LPPSPFWLLVPGQYFGAVNSSSTIDARSQISLAEVVRSVTAELRGHLPQNAGAEAPGMFK
jgi:hypothetical protein